MTSKTSGPIEVLREAIFEYGSAHPERIHRFRRDEIVIRQGEQSDLCYLIKSGTVSVLVGSPASGNQVEVALRYAREFIGETAFLQQGVARTATVIVRSDDAELIGIARGDLYAILAHDPSLHDAIASLWELSASRRRETVAVVSGRVEIRTSMMSGVLADLHNFSGLGEVVWEEELDDFLFNFIEFSSDAVGQFDGTFEEQGDGFKAVFGGPSHAARAVRFAVEVRDAFRVLRDARAAENAPFKKLGLGVGICTDFMSERRREAGKTTRVLSHALNVAAAISKYRESVSEAQIYVDPLTMQIASLEGLRFGERESIALDKLGRRQPVHKVQDRRSVSEERVLDVPSSDESGRVFISYAHADHVFVDALISRLETDGVIVWRDNNEILVGDDIDRAISRGIQDNLLFLIVLSPFSVNSDWVAREFDEASHEAVSGSKVLLPVLAGGLLTSELPHRIRRKKAVTFEADFDTPYRLLLRSIQEHSRRARLASTPGR